MNFNFNNKSGLVKRRAELLLNRVAQEAKGQDINTTLSKIYNAFTELYSNLGKPLTKLEPFKPEQMPRSAKLNATMESIEADLNNAYKESKALSESFIEVFNYSRALSTELLNSTDRLSSKVIDLKIISGQENDNIIVAGDDFNDLSKVDQSFPTQNQKADISPSQGIVTLARLKSNNVINDKVQVSIIPLKPDGLSIRPTVGNENRFYEGNFYNFIGQARPEGGKWHLEETASVLAPLEGQSSVTYVSNGPSQTSQLDPFIGNTDGPVQPGQVLKPEDIIVYDRGASESEKQISRSQMMDSSPASFWECEYVKTAPEIQKEVDDSRLVTPNDNGLTSVGVDNESNALVSSVTLDDLRSKSAILSNGQSDDFVIALTITLDAPKTINWISINPNNFEETSWMEITNIEYSQSNTSQFITIPSFDSNIHENILTDDANAELTSDEQGSLLAPNKYNFKGIGIWTFDPIETRVIRITIKQRTAVPSPHQRLAVRLHRVFTQVYTESQGSDGMM